MSLSVRIGLIVFFMAAVIGGSYWYMQITTGTVETVAEQRWRLHDNLMDVSFCDAACGWAVGQYGTILHSTDGGKSWSYQKSACENDLLGVCAIGPQQACAVGNRGTVLMTADGGGSWKPVDLGVSCLLTDVTFTSGSEGWIVGEFESIYHSIDGGATWKLVNGGEPAEIDFSQIGEDELVGDDFGMEEVVYTLKSVLFLNPRLGWAVGEYGTVVKTTDGGATWQKQHSGTEHSLTDVDFLNETFGFAVGLDGTIIRTTDGGTTWSADKPTVSAHYYGVAFKHYGPESSCNDAVAVGQGIIATFSYFKNPYLQNWVPALEMQYRVDYNWLNRIVFIGTTGEEAVAVGDEGLILYSGNGGDEWDIVRYPEKTVQMVMNP